MRNLNPTTTDTAGNPCLDCAMLDLEGGMDGAPSGAGANVAPESLGENETEPRVSGPE